MAGTNGRAAPTQKSYRSKRRLAARQLDKGLPCNLEMECELLESVIVGGQSVSRKVFSVLEENDFVDGVNRILFSGLREAIKNGVPLDTPATLLQWLKESNVTERISQEAGLNETEVQALARAMQAEGSVKNVDYYCKTLRRLRCERAKILVATDLLNLAHQVDAKEWVVKARSKVEALGRKLG